MKTEFITPPLLPGAWYLTYTSDEDMKPVYVQPINIEQDANNVWVATFRDSVLGERTVKEGEKLFAFSARVSLPVLDPNAPNLLEQGEMFSTVNEQRALMAEQRELQERIKRLKTERLGAGGTR